MSTWQIFRWPLAIGLLTFVGLISGLVSDGWGDAIAALGLFIPAAVAAWFWFGTRRRVVATERLSAQGAQPQPPV
jgi:hypothetical protein